MLIFILVIVGLAPFIGTIIGALVGTVIGAGIIGVAVIRMFVQAFSMSKVDRAKATKRHNYNDYL